MGTENNNGDSFIYHGPLATRMACHMGDRLSPVICNILGDQPLFYIDYVDADEAELDASLGLLTGEQMPAEFYPENLDSLRARMARLEGASQHIDG